MSWIDDRLRGKVGTVPLLKNPLSSDIPDNSLLSRGGSTEANNGVYWVGANGRFYTNDSVRGVVDRGLNYSPPGGYTRINDPNPPKPTGGSVMGNNTGFDGVGYSAPAKVLDTVQLKSLDSLIESLGTVKSEAFGRAGLKRNTIRKEKEEEKTREKGKYDSKKLSTLQDFAGAKTDTDINTRDTLENLVSSLSTLGLGGSRALTRQILDAANKSNRKANATQAVNNQSLDNSWNDYTVGNGNDMRKIDDQYGFDTGEAEKAYLSGKQNALYKKAEEYKAVNDAGGRSSVVNEADALNSAIARASFSNPSYTGEAKTMATPDLSKYTQDIAKYDTTGVGVDPNVDPLTSVASNGVNAPGNLAIRALAVNDKDLGIKKRTEAELGYGV